MEHWNRYIYKQTSPTKQSQHLYIHLTAMLSPCNDLCRKQLPSAQFSARVVLPMSQPWFLQCLIPDPLLRSFWFGSWTSGCYKPHPSWRCASYPASLPSCDVEKLMCRSPPLWFSMHSTFCILVYASASTAVWLVLRGWEGCSLLTMVVPAVDSSLHGPFATCLWPSISSLCNATTIKPCTKECWQRCTGFVATHNLFVLNNIIFIYICVYCELRWRRKAKTPYLCCSRIQLLGGFMRIPKEFPTSETARTDKMSFFTVCTHTISNLVKIHQTVMEGKKDLWSGLQWACMLWGCAEPSSCQWFPS